MLKHYLLAFALALPFTAGAQTDAAKAAAAKPAVAPKAAAAVAKPADAAKAAAATKQAETAPGDVAKAPNPNVVLHTSMGDITIELYPEKAPKSVENFLQYTREGFYNGTIFHRVINGFMVQGGGFTRDLTQKKTHAPVHNEANNGLSNLRGTVAMARTGDPHSATAQFFINLVDNKRLDFVSEQSGMTYGYCVFGKVTAGMDVVEKIKAVETAPQGPLPGDVPKTAIVIEKAELAQ